MRQGLHTHEAIAKDLGVERSTVSKMLKRVSDREMKKLGDQVQALKFQQVAQLEGIASEAFRSWEASKKTKATVSKTQKPRMTDGEGQGQGPGDMELTAQTTRAEGQTGNVAYLNTAMEALKQIRVILGLDAPLLVASTTPDGKAAPNDDSPQSLSRSAIRIAAILDAARTRRDGGASGGIGEGDNGRATEPGGVAEPGNG